MVSGLFPVNSATVSTSTSRVGSEGCSPDAIAAVFPARGLEWWMLARLAARATLTTSSVAAGTVLPTPPPPLGRWSGGAGRLDSLPDAPRRSCGVTLGPTRSPRVGPALSVVVAPYATAQPRASIPRALPRTHRASRETPRVRLLPAERARKPAPRTERAGRRGSPCAGRTRRRGGAQNASTGSPSLSASARLEPRKSTWLATTW